MRKIKVFTGHWQEVEKAVNDFFAANPTIQVHSIHQSEALTSFQVIAGTPLQPKIEYQVAPNFTISVHYHEVQPNT